ncbi:Smr/MutS family protein [Phenylobacterium sp.]|uniref:Smr/MutS family protein n=1 Tax=Phenylobacterium sp. TaxID=1871053 RepID=UPI0035B37E04
MKRPLRPEELKLWSAIAATVHPLPGKAKHVVPTAPPAPAKAEPAPTATPKTPKTPPAGFELTPFTIGQHAAAKPRPVQAADGPQGIEPRRKHRIAKERDPIGARIDLHGMTQDRAQAALTGFLRRAWDEGFRAVLVITGKGVGGDGVLRRRTPEWLADPALREVVAGISEAHRRHGGEGAIYVALKRKTRD